MSEHKASHVSEFAPPHGSLRSLTIGFVGCVLLSLAAYLIATSELSGMMAMAIIGVLAAVQCTAQLIVFLHLGTEFRPRWRLGVFILMLSIIFIVVAGSLWIMDNLNYRMMYSPRQLQEYIQGQDGL